LKDALNEIKDDIVEDDTTPVIELVDQAIDIAKDLEGLTENDFTVFDELISTIESTIGDYSEEG